MKILSKDEMKKVMGGVLDTSGSCSVTYQDSSGGWHTETGTCDNYIVWGGYIPYCHTSSFTTPVALSSNGGESKCGSAVYYG